MKISSRISAIVQVLDTIASTNIPADKVLAHWNKNNRYAGAKDKTFIATTVYNILRNRMACVWWCEKYTTPPTPTAIVLTYVYFAHQDIIQDAFFDTHSKHALPPLNTSNKRLYNKLQSHTSLYSNDMPDFVYCNVPAWMYPLFQQVYGESTRDILVSLNCEAPVDIRVNSLKSTVQAVQQELQKNGIKTTPIKGIKNGLRLQKRHSLSRVSAFQKGWFEIQDASSQRASALVHAKRGDKVVDFCAGAGGKALAIAAQMDNTGQIICCDISEKRLQRAKRRLKRAGVNNTTCRVLSSESDKWIKRRNARHDGGFDKVIVDAPCTGTGTWRRNPERKWRTSPQDLTALTALQQRILQSACRLVVKGGELIYMTCSVLQQENEDQIDTFLRQNPHFELGTFASKIPLAPMLRFRPTTDTAPTAYDGDGFFIAILVRKMI